MEFEIDWNEYDKIIRYMNDNHFGVSVGASWVFGWKKPINGSNNYELILQKEAALQSMYSHKKIQVGVTRDGNKKYKSWANIWLSDDKRRNYNRLVFKPTSKVYPDEFNIWQGFNIDQKKYDKATDKQCSNFVNFIFDVIANQNRDIYSYILYWLADMIQRPEEKQGVALVFKSTEEGTGKSFFCETIGTLFGPHYMLAAKSDQIIGRFSGHLENNILLGAEEAVFAGDKKAKNVLKDMITNKYRNIERKSIDIEINKVNYSHIIFMSNEDHVISASTTDRRFQVIEVPTKRIRDRPYFADLEKHWDAGEKESFLKLLQSLDVSKLDLINSRIMTDEMRQQIELSLPRHDQWIKRILDDQFIECIFRDSNGDMRKEIFEFTPLPNVVSSDDMYSNYLSFCKENNTKYPKVKSELSALLKKLFPSIKSMRQMEKGAKRTMWVLPGIYEMIEQWNRKKVIYIESGQNLDSVDSVGQRQKIDAVHGNGQYN
jgi:hypothetical protein